MLVTMSACQDLAVDNENSPNRVLALAEPGDVENLIANTFSVNWRRQWSESSMMISTIADEISSSWANWGMRDMSSEPRIAWNNSPSYAREESTEDPWFNAYTAISDANDGLSAIAAAEADGSPTDNSFTQEGIDTARLRAFAKFNQAWAHAWLAEMFDQAFIVDENVDLTEVALGNIELNLSPYQDVLAAAIGMMDEAIAIASANEFTITATEDWVYGLDFTNTDLVQLGNSLKARWLATTARSAAERAAADWNQIMTLINAGIAADFTPIGDDDGNIREWDAMKFYGQEGDTWARMDYRTIGPADESGGYQNWLATPVEDRQIFDVITADRRIVGDAEDPSVPGKYADYRGVPGPFPAARGTYHFSSHTHSRWREYLDNNANGPMPYMLRSEMDLMMAEGLLRTGGSLDEVASLINLTRVPNGELNPATGTDPAGAPSDAASHLDGASLWAKLKYEFRLETYATASGLAYYTDRGWGDLVTNTPIHFPVPGKELETLGLAIYTFGGGGDGSAPKHAGSAYWRNLTPEKGLRTRRKFMLRRLCLTPEKGLRTR